MDFNHLRSKLALHSRLEISGGIGWRRFIHHHPPFYIRDSWWQVLSWCAICSILKRHCNHFILQGTRKIGICVCVRHRQRNSVCIHMWHIFKLHCASIRLHSHFNAVFNWNNVLSWISALSRKKEAKWCKWSRSVEEVLNGFEWREVLAGKLNPSDWSICKAGASWREIWTFLMEFLKFYFIFPLQNIDMKTNIKKKSWELLLLPSHSVHETLHKHFFVSKEAETSIKFYRGMKSNAAEDQLNTPMERVKIEFESIKSLISERANGETRIELNDFCKNSNAISKLLNLINLFPVTRPAKKVLSIGVGLMFLEQFSGVFALLFFVSTIFQYSGSSNPPNQSSIIVGIIQLIGAYCSTMLVDRAGRRLLISTSAFGISGGLFVFALYSYLNGLGHVASYLNWIPLASFSFVLFIANFGVLTLPFLVMSELMITLPKVSIRMYMCRKGKTAR